jgi:hypothetical protein
MSRTLAKTDLSAAIRYHRERRKAGMIRLDGPAAPPNYRKLYRMAGFGATERLAALLR